MPERDRKFDHATGLGKTLDNFPEAIELAVLPVNSVVSVKYIDTAGVEQTLSSVSYQLDNAGGYRESWVVPARGYAWPSTDSGINSVKCALVQAMPMRRWFRLN